MEYRLLGNVEAVANGTVKLPGARVRTLLAVLLLDHGQTVPIGRTVDALWDTHPPHTAIRQVQHCVSLLRKTLTAAGARTRVSTHTSGYRLDLADDDSIDAVEFDRLVQRARDRAAHPGDALAAWQAALALWRGPALADVVNTPLAPRAEFYNQQRVVATEEHLACLVNLDRYAEAIAGLTSLCLAEPLRERPVELLIQALRGVGRRIEALDHYQRFSTRLADELGIDPSDRLQNLHRELLRGTMRAPVTPSISDIAPRTPTPTPAELPADLAGFTGRAETMRQLRKFTDSRGAIMVITGTGGIGKTSVAVRLGHELADQFTDGRLYLDLRTHSPCEPMTPMAALARVMRSLGATLGPGDTDVDELAGRYRTLVHDKRLLIVLDDVADYTQVLPLLPGASGSLVIVTSRNDLPRLTGRADAVSVPLGPLDRDDAVAMLRGFLDDGRAADTVNLDLLAHLCTDQPMALRLTGERLRRRPRLRLSDAVTTMAGSGMLDWLSLPGDPGVRGALDASYQALPSRLRTAWRRLAVSPLRWHGADTTAAATCLSIGDSQGALETLEAKHLLGFIEDKGHHLDRLTLAYAVERSAMEDPPSIRETVATALLTRYVDRIDAAYQMLSPEFPPIRTRVNPALHFSDKPSAMTWLHRESDNLGACIEYAAIHEPARCWPLVIGMTNWWVARGDRDQWRDYLDLALDAARAVGDRHGQWRLHHGLGLAHHLRGCFAPSRAHLRKSVALAEQLGHADDSLWTLSILSELEIENSRHVDARNTLDRAIGLLPSDGRRPRLEATLYRNLGNLLLRTGAPEEAIAPLRRANTILSGIGAAVCRSYVEIALGEVGEALDDPVGAGRHYRQALRLLDDFHDHALRARAHVRMAAHTIKHDTAEEAVPHLAWLLSHLDSASAATAAEARRLIDDFPGGEPALLAWRPKRT